MPEELKKLKYKRGSIKSKLTKFNAYLDSFDPVENSLVELRIRRDNFQPLLKDFEAVQDEIEVNEKGVDHDDERDSFETLYFNCLTKVEIKLTARTQTAAASPINEINMPLPNIALPTFTGSYDQWISFFETFQSLIHNNGRLNKIQRFHYLKSCLKGDAACLIETLGVSEANYDTAWQLIKERFENKRILIKTHVEALFSLPPVIRDVPSTLRALLDATVRNLKILENLKLPTDSWDVLIIWLVVSKFDFNTKRDWEQQSVKTDVPTFIELKDFINDRCKILEAMSLNKSKPATIMNTKTNNTRRSAAHLVTNKPRCPVCKQAHYVTQCDAFLNQAIELRLNQINHLKLCSNCLRTNHAFSDCRSISTCKHCKQRHHTLLHPLDNSMQNENNSQTDLRLETQTAISTHCSDRTSTEILLSTAIINVFDRNGKVQPCRALLDVGSQINFITKNMCDKLKLRLKRADIPICGINQSNSRTREIATIKFKSTQNAFQAKIECLVLDQITENLPLKTLSLSHFTIPSNITLADPGFHVTAPIDILLGAEIFWQLLCVGQLKVHNSQPYFQKTQLGWVVGGRAQAVSVVKRNGQTPSVVNLAIKSDLDNSLKRFWELEEIDAPNKVLYRSPEENACEIHFSETYKRTLSGRFMVRLPTKPNLVELGSSLQLAKRRFYNLEAKLQKNSDLKEQYSSFMREYVKLEHMEIIPRNEIDKTEKHVFYLPHHAVFKESSTTTKLRVVFDGSAKTSSGVSLNDTLMVGPVIQQDLFSILARFRSYQIVIAADITKMYRQILIHPANRDLQRVLWRENPNEPLETYRLKTVTYGTAPSSFLAIRCLHELARIESINYPLAETAILRDFYVDDLLTGANNLTEAVELKNQITQVLKKGGFELQKWLSNDPELISRAESVTSKIKFDKQVQTRILGLLWDSVTDNLRYAIAPPITKEKVTKRTILSHIAQIFDPLGLLTPVTLTAKILLQSLWSLNLHWDESTPINIHSSWTEIVAQLGTLNNLRIPRKVISGTGAVYELHGFSDASEKAYAACIYFKTKRISDESDINLLCAKSRVAPLKTTSLPRLELCGALLLARLMNKIAKLYEIPLSRCYCWTDSTITLAWITAPANKWQTFVANRVSEIQSLTDLNNWNHVPTKLNPADLPSRGMQANDLIASKLWWTGPEFLLNFNCKNEYAIELPLEVPEKRKQVFAATAKRENEIFKQFSSYTRLQRVVAWCFRFINNANPSNRRLSGYLTANELQRANISILKAVQTEKFAIEIADLKQDRPITKASRLLCLDPFVDPDQLLRVGGRLNNAPLSYSTKHPILLPSDHYVSDLIIKREHERQLHAGPQGTLAAVRQNYWPISGRNAVRKITRRCLKCFRANPRPYTQIMGNLPTKRVEQPIRPFINCGVDFAGPIMIKESTGRGKRITKGYIALFVCLNVKAIHLELAGNLTTDAFLGALKRFIARRGNISQLYSDNATNFVGASRELQTLYQQFQNQNDFKEQLANDNITWHFIPPRSPHFGGLWEAGVKAVKGHLRRILGNAILTYEEMYTVLSSIEACVNSRPITPLTSDPNDLSFLPPGHFIIGDSLTAPVEPEVISIAINRLSRWQHVERIRQHFWQRWRKEYLSTLQQRSKWKTTQQGPQINDVIVIKDENVPPLKWTLGRVVECHPGADGITRVVSVKTNSGVVKRAITKMCPLPMNNNL